MKKLLLLPVLLLVMANLSMAEMKAPEPDTFQCKVKERCDILGLTHTSDYDGYFGYNKNFQAYIEVISFDRLLNSAKQRNRAFFDKLGLPSV